MIIDVICAVIALYGFWVGYSRGIIKTVLTTISFLFGFMAAAKFSPTVSTMLQEWIDGPGTIMLPAAFLLTFILTLVMFRMLANGLENMLEAVNINFINQIMGGGISMFFFVFLYSVLVSFADNSRMIDPDTKEDSITYTMLQPIPEYAWSAGQRVWPVFQEFYQHALDVMDQIDSSVERQENDKFFDIEEDENDQPRRY
ncbi:MAG: CvpA family protein [Lewinella sp.]|jgi:membrane protein required for colicin V production|uniref:CvpA family protein n=1 Tax=Lewinella sp. TaxID=2004506 RepID=UPI003D6BF35A